MWTKIISTKSYRTGYVPGRARRQHSSSHTETSSRSKSPEKSEYQEIDDITDSDMRALMNTVKASEKSYDKKKLMEDKRKAKTRRLFDVRALCDVR